MTKWTNKEQITKKKLKPATNPSLRIKNKTETHQKEEKFCQKPCENPTKTIETNSQNCELKEEEERREKKMTSSKTRLSPISIHPPAQHFKGKRWQHMKQTKNMLLLTRRKAGELLSKTFLPNQAAPSIGQISAILRTNFTITIKIVRDFTWILIELHANIFLKLKNKIVYKFSFT